MTDRLREAMSAAWDAETVANPHTAYNSWCRGYEAALRAALAEPVPEAVAWMDEFGNVFPLAAYNGGKSWRDDYKRKWTPLYAHPITPPAARKPAEPATPEDMAIYKRISDNYAKDCPHGICPTMKDGVHITPPASADENGAKTVKIPQCELRDIRMAVDLTFRGSPDWQKHLLAILGDWPAQEGR